MKYLCLAYYDPAATDALPKSELAAIVKQCPPHDDALRESGRLLLQASLGKPTATRAINWLGDRDLADRPSHEV